jgi:hypothetical protein
MIFQALISIPWLICANCQARRASLTVNAEFRPKATRVAIPCTHRHWENRPLPGRVRSELSFTTRTASPTFTSSRTTRSLTTYVDVSPPKCVNEQCDPLPSL